MTATRGRKPNTTSSRSRPDLHVVDGDGDTAAAELQIPDEPDWRDFFPVTRKDETKDANQRARADARYWWRYLVAALSERGTIALEDAMLLEQTCIAKARINQLERALSVEGFMSKGDRGGVVKNPAAVALNQYSANLKVYLSQLGLSPTERARRWHARTGTGGDSPASGADDLWDF